MNHDIKWNFELWISISRLARCMPGGLFVCCCVDYIGFAYPLNLSLTSPCGQLLRQTMPINQMSTWQLYLSMELIQFTICLAGVFFFDFLTTIWNTWISQCCWQQPINGAWRDLEQEQDGLHSPQAICRALMSSSDNLTSHELLHRLCASVYGLI